MQPYLLATLLLLPQLVATAAQPNIVLVLADDLGYGDIRANDSNSKISTPNIDRLATQGIRFTDAHSPASVCTPTRYAVLTGRYAWRTRLKRGVLRATSPPLLEHDRLTLPAMLQEAGYQTACVGKWHLGRTWTLREGQTEPSAETIDWTRPLLDGPLQHGFTYYFGLGKPGWTFMENDRVLALPDEPFDLTHLPAYLMGPSNNKGFRSPGFRFERMLPRFTEEAVGFIDRTARSRRPFFLYFTPITPHRPVVPNEGFLKKSAAGLYGDFVVEFDWAVGQIMMALERNGLTDETLIIVTSDNGPEVDAYRRILEYRHYSMGEFRGVKRDLWEGGHHVPFIARWPERIPAGKTSGEAICLTDLMATVAHLIERDLPQDAGEDSYDILPALLDQRRTAPIREAVVHHSANGYFAIRQGDWVYIDHKTGDANSGNNAEPKWFRRERGAQPHSAESELFHLAEDLPETINLTEKHRGRARAMKALLEKYKKAGRSAPIRN
jgi:arylsulfatase A-like enzyme